MWLPRYCSAGLTFRGGSGWEDCGGVAGGAPAADEVSMLVRVNDKMQRCSLVLAT